MRKYIPAFTPNSAMKMGILFVVYYITAKFGLNFYAIHHFATMFWLPAGISLAFLLLYGYNLWPAITLAAFIVNYTNNVPFSIALGIAIGNTLEAIVGTYLLRFYIILYRCFERLGDTLYFIGVIVLLATPISAIIGVGTLLWSHIITVEAVIPTFFSWWIGNALGALVVTPFLLTTLAPTRPWNADSLPLIEILGFLFTIIFSNILIFWYPFTAFKNLLFLYLILLPLIWGGLRFGTRGMTLSILITSIIATLGTALGRGPFIMTPSTSGILFLQIFIGTIAITFLIFISIVKERRLFMHKLEDHVSELENALKEISSADQAKNDFLAILGHELRNPLAPIVSSLEIMKYKVKENKETTEITPLINTIENHMYTMTRLLNDLMDISRISRKKLILEKGNFNLLDAIHRSIETTRSKFEEKNHNFKITLPQQAILVFGDPVRIEQIIVNLLVNAAKYTQENGNVEIVCKIKNNTVVIIIKDNGMGIEPHLLGRIFEPFTQVHKHQGSHSSGLGVGLSLTQELVNLHGGNIRAESRGLGMGSEFTVTLPLSEPASNLEIKKKRESLIERSFFSNSNNVKEIIHKTLQKKFRVLIVDDNVIAAQGIAELLHYKGHTAESVYDAISVIDRIKKFRPDVVILDIGLPGMTGYELAEKIRQEIIQELTLIALTGYGQESDKNKAKRSGFDFHLTKPAGIDDIEKILFSL